MRAHSCGHVPNPNRDRIGRLDGCVKPPRSACCWRHWVVRRAFFLLEGIAVVFLGGCAYVAAGGLVRGRFELNLDPGGGG